MGENIFIISLIGGLILPFALLNGWGRWFWITTMSVIGLVVVTAEIIGMQVVGKTISRMYWEWSLAHETTSWIVAIILVLGWTFGLVLHLQWKVIKRRLDKRSLNG